MGCNVSEMELPSCSAMSSQDGTRAVEMRSATQGRKPGCVCGVAMRCDNSSGPSCAFIRGQEE